MVWHEDEISCGTHASTGVYFSMDTARPILFSTARRAMPNPHFPGQLNLMPDIRTPDVLIENVIDSPLFSQNVQGQADGPTPEQTRAVAMTIWHDRKRGNIAHAHIDRTVLPPHKDNVSYGNVPRNTAENYTGALGTSVMLSFSTEAGLTLHAAGSRGVMHIGPGGRNIFMPDMSHSDERDTLFFPASDYVVTSTLDTAFHPYMYAIEVTQTTKMPVSESGRLRIRYDVEAMFSSLRFEDIRGNALALLREGNRDITSFDPLFNARVMSLEMDFVP